MENQQIQKTPSVYEKKKEIKVVSPEQLDSFKAEIMTNYKKELSNFFKKDEKEMLKFMSSIVHCITKIPDLLNDRQGLIQSVLELVQIGLTPGIGQEAYILPYKGKSTALIGYQGFVKLLYDTGISSIFGEIVYQNDTFENIMGTDPQIVHKINPSLSKKERGEAIGAYVVVKFRGEKIFKYMNKADILEFRDNYSQSYKGNGKQYSLWNEINDPELNMWKKTILKQMIKFLPKTPQIEKASELDNKEALYDANREVQIGGAAEAEKASDYLNKKFLNKEEA